MGVRVKDFLESPIGRQLGLLAGQNGINNDIPGVTIIEVPDIVRYIDGGEALMTGLYAFQSCSLQEFCGYFDGLREKHVSAIFLKKRQNIHELPAKLDYLTSFCNENAIPLLEVPEGLPFPKIMNFIMEQLVDEEVTMMKYFRTTHDNFFAITLKNSSEKESIREICDMLQQLIGNPVEVFDQHHQNILTAGEDQEILDISDQAETFDPGIFSKNRCLKQVSDGHVRDIIRLNNSGVDYLFLTVDEVNDSLTAMDFTAIENAGLALQLEYSRLCAFREIEKKYQKNLIESLLLDKIESPEELRKCLESLKLKQDGTYRLYAFAFEGNHPGTVGIDEKMRGAELAERKLQEIFRNAVVYRENDHVIVMKQETESLSQTDFLELAKEKLDQVQKVLTEKNTGLFAMMGISKAADGALGISKAYQEALDALKYSSMLGIEAAKSPVMLFSELGVFRYLLQIEDSRVLREYLPETLNRLLEVKSGQREELVRTLRVYLNNDRNLSQTAQELFVHYKTAAYRIDKITKITGINFDDPNQVLSARIGLTILLIIENLERKLV